MPHRLLFLPLFAFLCACSGTVTVFPVEEGAEPVFDTVSEGVLVGSSMFAGIYTGDGKRFPGTPSLAKDFRCSNYSLLYRGTEPATEAFVGNLSAIPAGQKKMAPEGDGSYDYDVLEGRGYVYATILPAGAYELWYRGYRCGNTDYYDHDFSVPFEVLAGHANYVGELQFRHRFGENFLGTIVFQRADVRLENAADRDVPLLNEKYPFLADLPIRSVDLEWQQMYQPSND